MVQAKTETLTEQNHDKAFSDAFWKMEHEIHQMDRMSAVLQRLTADWDHSEGMEQTACAETVIDQLYKMLKEHQTTYFVAATARRLCAEKISSEGQSK